MYTPSETQAAAGESERRQMDQSESPRGFRPVALPALTAAIRSTPATGKTVKGTVVGRQGVLAIVHEDEPND